jgi:hypothetical protein
MRVTLSPDYVPSEEEEFMNPMQLEFFSPNAIGLALRFGT